MVVEGGAVLTDALVVELLEEHHDQCEFLGCDQLLGRRTVHSGLCPVVDTSGVREFLEPRVQLEEGLAADNGRVSQATPDMSTVIGLRQDVGVDLFHRLGRDRGADRIGPDPAGKVRTDHEGRTSYLIRCRHSASGGGVLVDQVDETGRVLPGQVTPEAFVERSARLGVRDARLCYHSRVVRRGRRRCCRGGG
ncbi:MAG: hypothetical protein JWO99_658 [Candidatus Saccharibacteria bacterium]|nr:hypothetical protein [Candidatus Saccharibacteria bacterium]